MPRTCSKFSHETTRVCPGKSHRDAWAPWNWQAAYMISIWMNSKKMHKLPTTCFHFQTRLHGSHTGAMSIAWCLCWRYSIRRSERTCKRGNLHMKKTVLAFTSSQARPARLLSSSRKFQSWTCSHCTKDPQGQGVNAVLQWETYLFPFSRGISLSAILWTFLDGNCRVIAAGSDTTLADIKVKSLLHLERAASYHCRSRFWCLFLVWGFGATSAKGNPDRGFAASTFPRPCLRAASREASGSRYKRDCYIIIKIRMILQQFGKCTFRPDWKTY